ncbi:MAG: ABC transporter ATP-binding protein [Nitrososphaerota archaeon]|nr:ABC transporter ATP-binding protein [Nitrososphaerota archaeon]MDG7023229.1 ABC transporter ATP-binding protein [Nitrososphaerota archaeon]
MREGSPVVQDAGGSSRPTIRAERVSSGYFGKKVIDGVTFSLSEPAVYVVLGPNGAEKTTLLRTLAGVLKPLEGWVEINGYRSETEGARGEIDYITHLDGIPEGMNVGEGLRFYARIQGATEGDVERVSKLLDIEGFGKMRFNQLSQGQKKRVSVARVFLKEKSVYLLDEPTSNLDPKVAGEIRDLVLNLSRDKIVLYSSHNLFEAREIGTHVIAIKGGKLSLFARIDEIRTRDYVVGVRTVGDGPPPGARREGDYYLFELDGPEDVPKLIGDLVAEGVRIRELREMRNPLEELFT